jgi:ATP-dependent Clp protease ATP-binding subunit ClpC
METLALIATSFIVWFLWRHFRGTGADTPPPQPTSSDNDTPADEPAAEPAPHTVQQFAAALSDAYDASNHPQELEAEEPFRRGVALMRDPAMPISQVAAYCISSNGMLEAMAAQAICERDDGCEVLDRIVPYVHSTRVWSHYFLFRAFQRHAPPSRPLIGEILVQAQHWWPDNPTLQQFLSELIDARVAAGETPDLTPALAKTPAAPLAIMADVAGRLTTPHAGVLQAQLAEWQRTQLNTVALERVGRLHRHDPFGTPLIVIDTWRDAVADAAKALTGEDPCGIVIVGESGAGKTSFFRAVADQVREAGWHVFEASATDVMAGQTFMGELEARIRELFDNLDSQRRVVWCVPNVHELVFAGQHRQSPVGVLDMILPAVEAGRLRLVGETLPRAFERLLQERPRVRGAFRTVRIEPLSSPDAQDLLRRVADAEFSAAGLAFDPALVQDTVDLARHYFSSRALPGSAIDLLRSTRIRVAAAGAKTVTRINLIETLASLTGLPHAVLDDREGLDSRTIREHFDARVMGQPEAVQCLIDRVAMLKAGLTDPGRPVGVFLFAGPTGTGKTEVAKTLATYLFGSPDRMIRLDMSEFQDPSSLARILGDGSGGAEVDALVNRIRKQPFSVVLLDEFEKGHPNVWDLFLQVFDDGRLTDARGNLADFRHSIIILTTNLGAVAHKGSSLGFNDGDSPFSEAQVTRAINQAFRPEFVNRLDRVVVFRPLSRTVMRKILEKELHDVLQRRGFRTRDWAVEWEDSAIEFLLEKGFTNDLGARPLRRAIDQHVLAPIALTIVEHRFPEGDQFLFVRSNGRAIEVEFVDPDSPPAEAAAAAEPTAAPPSGMTLQSLVLAPEGTPAARAFLETMLAELSGHLEAQEWVKTKAALLTRISAPGFWEDTPRQGDQEDWEALGTDLLDWLDPRDRHAVTDLAERMDRIEAGAETARSLMQRLERRVERDGKVPQALVASVAEQIYLVRAALADAEEGAPSDVYLIIDRVASDPRSQEAEVAFLRNIVEMYKGWAKARRMQLKTVGGDVATGIVLSAAGFGAHHILQPERGLHVLEVPVDETNFERRTVRVGVVPQPVTPRPAHTSEFDFAMAEAQRGWTAAAGTVVRRYREKPSPLVRDAVRNWRTGRYRQVMEGAFDLVE